MMREESPSLYEILDVPEAASGEEIERAYRIAAATYQPGSTAVYSVFTDEESAGLLRQVERAYRVLSNPGTRRDYDSGRCAAPVPRFGGRPPRLADLAGAAAAIKLPPPDAQPPDPQPPELRPPDAAPLEAAAAPAPELGSQAGAEPEPSPRPLPPAPPPLPPADLGVPPDGVYDGAILQRVRVSRGIELEEVSGVTKINANYIRYIEGNRYELLPAPVYVKGFVREIARALRLDPVRVSETYMARYRQSTGKG
jgi:hypothetical protein